MLSVNRKTSTNQKKEKKRSEEAKIFEPSYKSNFEVAGGGPGLLHHPSVCPSFGSGSPSTTAVDPQ